MDTVKLKVERTLNMKLSQLCLYLELNGPQNSKKAKMDYFQHLNPYVFFNGDTILYQENEQKTQTMANEK